MFMSDFLKSGWVPNFVAFCKNKLQNAFFAVAPGGYYATRVPAIKANGGGILEFTMSPCATHAVS